MNLSDYLSDPALSRSAIMHFIESPELYHAMHVAKTMTWPEPSPSMKFGSMVDAYLTEGIAPTPRPIPHDARELPADALDKNGNKKSTWAKHVDDPTLDWWSPEKIDKWHASEETRAASELVICERIANQVADSKAANSLVFHPRRLCQQSFFFDYDGRQCKTRPDIVISDAANVDVKTSNSVTPKSFARHALDFGYDIQQAMFERVHDVPTFFVVIHSAEPYEVEVYQLDCDYRHVGRLRFDAAIRGIASCEDSGIWRSRTHGRVTEVAPPRFYEFLAEYAA